MKYSKRIIPFILIFATIFSSFVIPAYAADSDSNGYTFWDAIVTAGNLTTSRMRALIFNDACPMCPNSDGRHSFVEQHTQVHDTVGNFYVCEYCGKSAGEVGADAYNNMVSEMPSNGYGSDGSLYWYPVFEELVRYEFDVSCYSLSGNKHFIAVDSIDQCRDWKLDMYWSAPCSGSYWCIYGGDPSGYVICKDGSYEEIYPTSFDAGYVGNLNKGDVFALHWYGTVNASRVVKYHKETILPYYKIVPTGDISYIFSIDSRPTSISAPVYYTDNSGQVTVTTGDVHLFSENDMTLTNPQTGTTSTVTDWSYDYSSRTYDLTLDSGEHSTVTYGDENITVKEGDTTYIYNYYVQPSNDDPNGGGNSDPEHKHEYKSTITREATCTTAGVETFSCECGNTYTKAIQSLGHDWTIKEQIPSAYDENGEETTTGYTIYKCSRCNEEYKSTDGKPPDGGGGSSSLWNKIGELLGTVGGGLLGLIGQFLSSVLDVLITLAQQIGEKLSRIVEMILGWFDEIPLLFGGFLGFLEAVFPFIPADAMLLLTFGMAAVVFIGIIKALRRR